MDETRFKLTLRLSHVLRQELERLAVQQGINKQEVLREFLRRSMTIRAYTGSETADLWQRKEESND